MGAFVDCSSYSSKAAPHADGLLITLAASLVRKQSAQETAEASGAPVEDHERARKILHSLVAATNNRMHKDFRKC